MAAQRIGAAEGETASESTIRLNMCIAKKSKMMRMKVESTSHKQLELEIEIMQSSSSMELVFVLVLNWMKFLGFRIEKGRGVGKKERERGR